jgi:hypothetical protein
MSTLRSLLAIHGSLDYAILRSDDPRVAETVDLFLPGASANTEWYREIESFMFTTAAGGARTVPDPVVAMNEINSARDTQPPTIPEMSRLLYGVGAIIRLKKVVPSSNVPRLDEGTANRNLLADVLALAGPGTFGTNRSNLTDDKLNETVNRFADEFTSWTAWYAVTQAMTNAGVLSAEVAAVPLCKASVVTVNGIESVVVDTEFSSDYVSLNKVKSVVDPRNWHNNYPGFFCETKGKGRRADYWRKMLETVGVCDVPFSRRLVTMLKFFKSETNGPVTYEARLDYDLNDPIPDPAGDGQITVDRGFINMWATNEDKNPALSGVFVRTRKVAHITGLRPYTLKRFVCIFGYAFGAMEMLFGSAKKDPDELVGYYPWIDRPEDDIKEEPTSSTAKPTPAPAPSSNTVASTAIKMWVACAEDLTVKNLDLADKWMAGQLSVAELAEYSAEVGARIAGDPWKFIQAIRQPKGGGK